VADTLNQVQTSPLAKRVAFLETKGLTNDEIEEALSRAQGKATTTAAAPAPAPAAVAALQQQQQLALSPQQTCGPFPLIPSPNLIRSTGGRTRSSPS